jgi:acetyltransferase-like isoleucine patch superfamily enzyme
MENHEFKAKGNKFKRLITLPFLFCAWFAPHKSLRVFFHRIRGVRIGRKVEIGYFCIIGNVHPELITIEDKAVITARVTILDHDNSYYYIGKGDVNLKPVLVKKNSFIGIGSVVMPGVTIGEGSIIGALSFINKNIPDHTVAAGNPVKVLRTMEKIY